METDRVKKKSPKKKTTRFLTAKNDRSYTPIWRYGVGGAAGRHHRTADPTRERHLVFSQRFGRSHAEPFRENSDGLFFGPWGGHSFIVRGSGQFFMAWSVLLENRKIAKTEKTPSVLAEF